MTRILSVEHLSKSFGGLQAVADLSCDAAQLLDDPDVRKAYLGV